MMMMMMMVVPSSSRACHNPNGVTLFLILCFLMFPSKSDGSWMVWNMSDGNGVVGLRVVGSRPPRCVSQCLPCMPCTATLVASQHHRQQRDDQYRDKSREESYYLLSWKCKCGDKLFQP